MDCYHLRQIRIEERGMMDITKQSEFLQKLINENRKNNLIDLLREWRMKEEQSHLNQIRSESSAKNWSL